MRTQIGVLSFWWIPVFSRRVVCFRIPVFSPCVIPFFIVCRDSSTVFFKMLPQIWDGRSATVIHIWRGNVRYNWITVLLIYWEKGTRRVDQILRLRATLHTIHLRASNLHVKFTRQWKSTLTCQADNTQIYMIFCSLFGGIPSLKLNRAYRIPDAHSALQMGTNSRWMACLDVWLSVSTLKTPPE